MGMKYVYITLYDNMYIPSPKNLKLKHFNNLYKGKKHKRENIAFEL